MKNILKKIEHWFELNFSWFLTNGNKQERKSQYLTEKYLNKRKDENYK